MKTSIESNIKSKMKNNIKTPKNSNISYCGDLLRRSDKDKFLLSMFMPANLREDLWSLFAFNYEISKTRAVVSDTNLGLIRLQWWRDEIARIYDGEIIIDHEILKPLSLAVKNHNLSREHFDMLLHAREFDLEDVAPSNMEGLLNYADFTTTPLLKLSLQICGVDPDTEIIQPVAINYALAEILRRLPLLLQQSHFLLPDDLLKKYNLTHDNIFDEKNSDAIKNIVEEIIGSLLSNPVSDDIILKSFSALSDIYIKQIKSLNYDILSPKMRVEPAFKALRLFCKIKIL